MRYSQWSVCTAQNRTKAHSTRRPSLKENADMVDDHTRKFDILGLAATTVATVRHGND